MIRSLLIALRHALFCVNFLMAEAALGPTMPGPSAIC